MKEKFLNYGCAMMAATAITVYFGNLGYHVILSIGTNKGYIKIRVFTEPNEELKLPSGYLYTDMEISHISEDDLTEKFDVIYFYFEYCNK